MHFIATMALLIAIAGLAGTYSFCRLYPRD
jgi:hypothetical protein